MAESAALMSLFSREAVETDETPPPSLAHKAKNEEEIE